MKKTKKSREIQALNKYGMSKPSFLTSVEEIRERKKSLEEMLNEPYENFHIKE